MSDLTRLVNRFFMGIVRFYSCTTDVLRAWILAMCLVPALVVVVAGWFFEISEPLYSTFGVIGSYMIFFATTLAMVLFLGLIIISRIADFLPYGKRRPIQLLEFILLLITGFNWFSFMVQPHYETDGVKWALESSLAGYTENISRDAALWQIVLPLTLAVMWIQMFRAQYQIHQFERLRKDGYRDELMETLRLQSSPGMRGLLLVLRLATIICFLLLQSAILQLEINEVDTQKMVLGESSALAYLCSNLFDVAIYALLFFAVLLIWDIAAYKSVKGINLFSYGITHSIGLITMLIICGALYFIKIPFEIIDDSKSEALIYAYQMFGAYGAKTACAIGALSLILLIVLILRPIDNRIN